MSALKQIKTLRDSMTNDLRSNILPFWMAATDDLHGGFLGEMTTDGTIVRDAPKSLVLNARILWSFASAYRVFKREEYLHAAKLAFDELTNYFWDGENGGGYYQINADHSVGGSFKMTYGQGFLLYAFSEYYRASGRPEALEWADRVFDYLETACREGGVYREFIGDPPQFRKRNDDGNEAPPRFPKDMRSMNTHLHIIEPVTNYFRIRATPKTEAALVNLIEVVTTKIYNEKTRHCDLFFDKEMRPISTNISFGHDIESSWLICEAAETLLHHAQDKPRARQLLKRCQNIAADMADAVLGEGLDPVSSAVYNEGDKDRNIIGAHKVWWAQAEGIVGFVNAWQLTGEDRYLSAAEKLWTYIQHHILTPNRQEWYATGTDSIPDENTGYLINAWKCPYHNSRAAMEIYERYGKLENEHQ